MADRVKELFEVKVYAVFISAVDDFQRLSQCLVRAPSRSEAVLVSENFGSYTRLENLGYGLLDYAGSTGGYAELAPLASFFGYLYPPYGIGAVASNEQTFSYFFLCSRRYGSSCSTSILSIPPLPLLALTCLYALLRLSGVRICSNILSDDSCTSTSSSPTIPIKVGAPSYLCFPSYSSEGSFLMFSAFSPFIR